MWRKTRFYDWVFVVIAVLMFLLSFLSVFVPDKGSSGSKYIYLEAYSGWKGVESMVTPLDDYVKSITGTSIHFSDLFWPLADAQTPIENS